MLGKRRFVPLAALARRPQLAAQRMRGSASSICSLFHSRWRSGTGHSASDVLGRNCTWAIFARQSAAQASRREIHRGLCAKQRWAHALKGHADAPQRVHRQHWLPIGSRGSLSADRLDVALRCPCASHRLHTASVHAFCALRRRRAVLRCILRSLLAPHDRNARAVAALSGQQPCGKRGARPDQRAPRVAAGRLVAPCALCLGS